MKILIDCHHPFALAHGGMQVQIEQTLNALHSLGVNAEPLRWWDDQQRGDMLHQFGPASVETIQLAHRQGMKVVMTLLLSQTCNRSPAQLWLRKMLIAGLSRLPHQSGAGRNSVWASCAAADHILVGLEAERRVVVENYRVPAAKVSTLPLGLPETFLQAAPATRDGNYLISVGTIAPVKRSLELARLARSAQVPVLFVGKPFEPGNAYWRDFSALIDQRWVRHQPHVTSETELIKIYQAARGFVLMSQYENWSFVAQEATACGLPLLLMDLPWSRERFGGQAGYFPRKWDEQTYATTLKGFFETAATLSAPHIPLPGWREVAQSLKQIYAAQLSPGTK